MREKFFIKKVRGQRVKITIRYLLMSLTVGLAGLGFGSLGEAVQAEGCPDLRVVFARGSGGGLNNNKDFAVYKETIEAKLQTMDLNYEFIDLDYPAVAIGLDRLGTTLGALIGRGEAYEFGKSVNTGVKNLKALVNGSACPGTKYVLGGYSQGAMVVSKALSGLNASRLIYAATFGDPKIYLPEGQGALPAACRGENLSDYRMYVPDCYAYKGMLGAYIPYEPEALEGKVGVWCNKRDIFCSRRQLNLGDLMDHISYIEDGLYEDASRVIFDKICQEFGLVNTVTSPHDTAILIDSTGSMSGLIAKYKNEAKKLAVRTLESGGRVALYDYRDYQEGYVARQRCAFETCDLASFEAGLSKITVDGGGDLRESLLASSLAVMQELNWKQGSTKSIVVLTDAGYHDPDFDSGGTTRLDVVALSRKIDPVNFYVITTPENVDSYADLASETGGRVVTTVDDLTELTDYIMERYDSLPRVEELDGDGALVPELTVIESLVRDGRATVKFKTDAPSVIVVLNDAILGVVEGLSEITLEDLDFSVENVLTLVPFSDTTRGDGVEVDLGGGLLGPTTLPKAPDTGRG